MRTVKSLAVLHTYWADPIRIPLYSTEPIMTKHSLIVPYHWLCFTTQHATCVNAVQLLHFGVSGQSLACMVLLLEALLCWQGLHQLLQDILV